MTLQEALQQPDVVQAVRNVLHHTGGIEDQDPASLRAMMVLTAVVDLRKVVESKGCMVPEYT